jgi:hypothetical protein
MTIDTAVATENAGRTATARAVMATATENAIRTVAAQTVPTTPTPTSTNIPTPTDTPTLEPTPTNTPSIVSSCVTPTYFQDVWRSHPQIGCPTTALTSDFTYQAFEEGIMAWQKSPAPSTIYAFFDNGRWERQPDPGGPPVPSCPEGEQTNGLGPLFGFGTLWCEPWNWKEQLGMPTDTEQDGKNNKIQNFENGTILTIGADEGFILYSDSRWEPFK